MTNAERELCTKKRIKSAQPTTDRVKLSVAAVILFFVVPLVACAHNICLKHNLVGRRVLDILMLSMHAVAARTRCYCGVFFFISSSVVWHKMGNSDAAAAAAAATNRAEYQTNF